MNENVIRDIQRRLDALEQTRPRLRVGEVTDLGPLDVALGGSDVPYEDVQAIGPVADGDSVAALVWGADLLVLGALNRGIRFGTGTVTITNGTNADSASIPHGVGASPTVIVATAREHATSRDDFVMTIVSRDSTNFVAGCRGAAAEDFPVPNPTTVTFDWIAIR